MADGIAIWSLKPVHQNKLLCRMTQASYKSNITFCCHGYSEYTHNNKKKKYPNQFTLLHNENKNIFMIFHITNIDKQKEGIGRWLNTKFKTNEGKEIIFPNLFRIAVSEDMDYEMTFNFAYNYLKQNRKDLISYIDYLIDWELIKQAYKKGYNENWYPIKSN